MARCAEKDPIERFRFSIEFVPIDINVAGATDVIAGLAGLNTFERSNEEIITRAGFSEMGLPKANITEMSYRENLDNQRFLKIPGLVRYEPIILKRGATDNRDLYTWYKQVHNEGALMVAAFAIARGFMRPPEQVLNYRKDAVIKAYNRGGQVIKQWFLFNVFPIAYKGGNDFDAQASDKLVQELTLTYEFFMELDGSPDAFTEEMKDDAVKRISGTIVDRAKDLIGL